MAGSDPITWDEIKEWCDEKRKSCKEVREAEGRAINAEGKEERRVDMQSLREIVEGLATDMNAVKQALSGRVYVLPRKLLYLLMGTCVGTGLAGIQIVEKLWKATFGG